MSSDTPEARRGVLGIAAGDGAAILWAIACCWLAAGGNYLLLAFGLTVFYIVPFDLVVVPLLVTVVLQALRPRRQP
jgi:hypothetical protein